MNRRHFLASAACLSLLLGSAAHAEDKYPSQNITVIVPYAPGSTDQFARAFGTELEKALGKTFLVEARPGGGGSVGSAYVAKSVAADGYNLLFAVSAVQTIAPHQNKLPYEFKDLKPIARVSTGPNVLAARVGAPFKTTQELVEYAKANPGAVTFASAGTGSVTHLGGEAFAEAAGIKLTHIPFQGVTPAVTAAVGGNVDLVIGFAQGIMPQVEGGRLIALGQMNAERTKVLPDVPTLKEAGVNLEMPANTGFWAPAETPDAVVDVLETAIKEASAGSAVADIAKKNRTELDFAGRADFAAELVKEDSFYKGLLDKLGMSK